MASSYKSSNSNIHRGKPYALMLLLAFGAAILGVMILHKLREKRIFSLLVKEKDHELLTLHLLFQREQEFNKDARKKIEEMKTKVYSLRSQKLELDRRLSEMESTIASLRDERKVIESTLEEKRNEIKMLTEEGMNSTFPQVSDLQNMIKMKETEIKQLKLRLYQTETNSISVTYSDDNATNGSQNNGIIREKGENLTNETEKSNNVDEDEPQMRREAASYKWVGDQGGNTDNGAVFVNTDENQEKKTVGLHSVRVVNVTEMVNGTSRESTSTLRDGLKLEKSNVGVSGLGIRVRRRHYRVKRLRDVRNRQSESALSNQEENVGYNTSQREVHLTQTEKLNQTRETGRDDRGSTETKSKGTKDAENADKVSSMNKKGNLNGNGKANVSSKTERNANVRKQIDDEINSGHDIDANRRLLKTHNVEINEGDAEEGKEIEIEESEEDESENTREPDIEREDVKRFAELDIDEEEADEAIETEF